MAVRIEFHRPDDEEALTVATATWDGAAVDVAADDEELRSALVRAFRRTPVVTDDGALRRLGTSGPVVLQPGDLEWFQAAALVRATAETRLAARVVPGPIQGGFDPAANYRTFEEQIERLVVGRPYRGTDAQP